MEISRRATITAALAAAVLTGNSAIASYVDLGTFTVSGTSPNDSAAVSASAHFVELSSTQLQITLSNTKSGDTLQIGDVLYGVFFSGAHLTGYDYGAALAGSSIWTYASLHSTGTTPGPLAANTVLQDPWGLGTIGTQQGVDGLTGSTKEGLVSTGFTGSNKGGLSNGQHQPWVESSAVFILTYSGTISDISDVKFLYGTASATINAYAQPVPEATTLLAGILLLLPFGASGLRILRNKLTS